jgi:hypothetical protein
MVHKTLMTAHYVKLIPSGAQKMNEPVGLSVGTEHLSIIIIARPMGSRSVT